MEKQEMLNEAKKSILECDAEKAAKIAEDALASGLDPNIVLNEGFIPGIVEVGDLFDKGQLFLPELILAGETMKAASEVCIAAMSESGAKERKKILIATVEGDIHDIGKSIVISFLKANGFETYDIGRDVPVETIIKKAIELGVEVIGTSALLTTTMERQRDLEKELRKVGVKDKFKTIVGGAPCSEHWAKRIGADAYAANAVDGLRKIKELTGLN
jgi:trimethylamine corrinoid protein